MSIINKDFKILVVDDNSEILDIITRPLIKANYQVFSAKNGAQCLEIFYKEKPDIILLDVMLPDANGIELAKEIKKKPFINSVYIILFSSLKTSYEDISEGLEKGADGYMIKPVNSRELLARVNSACRIVKAEREINQKNKELTKLNNEKDKFFSIIAHDLKSPFNSILGFSNLLLNEIEKKDYDKSEKYAKIVLKSSYQAMDLLANLMVWSRSQTGRMQFNPTNFDMTKLIEEVTQQLSIVAQQKNINLVKNTTQSFQVLADVDMISTVLRNLISNAVKFTNIGGNIMISVIEEPSQLKISVIDDGIGIPQNKLETLFQLDQNYSTIGTLNEKGTGLGLILCKDFIEKHHGAIWAESELGKGSCFNFTLPFVVTI